MNFYTDLSPNFPRMQAFGFYSSVDQWQRTLKFQKIRPSIQHGRYCALDQLEIHLCFHHSTARLEFFTFGFLISHFESIDPWSFFRRISRAPFAVADFEGFFIILDYCRKNWNNQTLPILSKENLGRVPTFPILPTTIQFSDLQSFAHPNYFFG